MTKIQLLTPRTTRDKIENRFLLFAGAILLIYSIILTMSPLVRTRELETTLKWMHWIGLIVWLGAFYALHQWLMRKHPARDPYLLPLMALVSGIGLLTIYRLFPFSGLKQSLWLLLSVSVIAAGFYRPGVLDWLRKYKYIWLGLAILLTALTIIFGTYPSGDGPRLWLNFFGVYFQPSEPLKLLLIVYLAAYLSERGELKVSLMKLILPTIIMAGFGFLILFVQRDLGTATVFFLLYFTMLYLATGNKRLLIIGAGIILLTGILGYQLIDVIHHRVNSWINPWLDPSGRSYQIVQSLIAVASGGILGRGPGIGNPVIVPVSISDFIYAAIGEELGLLGTLGLLVLFAFLLHRGMKISTRASNKFQRYLAAGITAFFCIQFILIVGGNLRLLPLTGVTLPFVSYGGSSFLTCSVGILLLLLISNGEPGDTQTDLNRIPYRIVTLMLMIGFLSLALLNGWWGIVRSDVLTSRTDNPRRNISDYYVMRGKIFDRNSEVLALSNGQPGSYARVVTYPALGSTIGYNSAAYGQSGLEASLDPYLRGLRGNPTSLIWMDHMLYGTPPPGLDIRLSIDLTLQAMADDLLAGHRGAMVLMNAKNGELLVMASHPYFDPNVIDSNMTEWEKLQDGPLLNRITQAQYPLGTIQGPFLMAGLDSISNLPQPPEELTYQLENRTLNCADNRQTGETWGTTVSAGCPGVLIELIKQFSETQVLDLYKKVGFTTLPDVPLQQAAPAQVDKIERLNDVALGISGVSVSPLQLVSAAAALSNDGKLPTPVLPIAVDIKDQGWVIFERNNPVSVLPQDKTRQTVDALSSRSYPVWQAIGHAYPPTGTITWFAAGTNRSWQGSPVALVILLEEDNSLAVSEMGETMIKSIISHHAQ